MNPTNIVHNSWNLPTHLLTDFKKISKKVPINPERKNLFRVFSLPKMDVRCVLMGLSPYQKINNEIRANGLAFGSTTETASLKIIRQSLWKSYHEIAIEKYFDNTMEYWHKQGVLLLNSSLSVPRTKQYGSPTDHINLWKHFISKVLQDLFKDNPVPIWLMGNHAQKFKSVCENSPLILESCHPVATSYQLNKVAGDESKIPEHLNFTITENFKILDEYFIKMNGEPLKWLNYDSIAKTSTTEREQKENL